jgi:hypothetical protein
MDNTCTIHETIEMIKTREWFVCPECYKETLGIQANTTIEELLDTNNLASSK